LDVSGYGHVLIQAGSPKLYRVNGVDMLYCPEGANHLYADHSSYLDVSNYSAFICGDLRQPTSGGMFRKLGSGAEHRFYFPSTTRIGLYNGTAVSKLINIDYVGAAAAGCSLEAGGVPSFYRNGEFVGVGDTVLTWPSATGRFYVGGASAEGAGYHSAALLYDGNLTADQHAALFAWSRTLHSPLLPADRRYFDMGHEINGSESGLIGAWDIGRPIGREVPDETSYSNPLTLTGAPAPVDTPAGRGLDFPGVSTSYARYTPGISTATELTLSCFAMFRGTDGSIMMIGGTNDGIGFRINPSNQMVMWDDMNNANASATGPVLAPGRFYHMALTVHENGNKEMFVDGVGQGEVAGGGDNFSVVATPVMTIGARWDGVWPLDGVVVAPHVRNYVMTDEEIKAESDKLAKRVVYDQDLSMVRPTLADVAAGSNIPGTDYLVNSGSYSVQEDSAFPTGKLIQCEADGDKARPQPLAYGSWHFGFRSQNDSSTRRIYLVADTPAGAVSVGGYSFTFYAANLTIALQKFTPGAATVWSTAAGYVSHDTYYEIWITRDYAGEFTTWIKGGAFTDWTLIDVSGGSGTNPIIENTVKASTFRVANLDGIGGTEDQVGLDRQYHGPVTPL
jgi:hypothetical protein